MLDNEHHMYPEHYELLPWIFQTLPSELEPEAGISDQLC